MAGRASPVERASIRCRLWGGLICAVGNNRTVLTSSNGVRWSVRMHNTNGNGWLCGVAHGNGRFVAVGFQRLYMYGPLASALYWGPPGSVGFSSNTHASIVVSDDGIQWKSVRPGTGSLSAIAFGGGRFVVVGLGGMITSTDGYTWTSANPVYIPDGRQRRISDMMLRRSRRRRRLLGG
jgi:hypothetical protein